MNGLKTIEGKKPKIGDVELDSLIQKEDHSIFVGSKTEKSFGKVWTIVLVPKGSTPDILSPIGAFNLMNLTNGVKDMVIDGDFNLLNGKPSNINIQSLQPTGGISLKSDYKIESPVHTATKVDGEMNARLVISSEAMGGMLNLSISDKNGKLVQSIDGYFNQFKRFYNIKIWSSGDVELKLDPEIFEGNLTYDLKELFKKLESDLKGLSENKQVKAEVDRLGTAPKQDSEELLRELRKSVLPYDLK